MIVARPTWPGVAGGGGAGHGGHVAQVGRQVLEVGGDRRARQRLVVLEQRQVAGVLLEVRAQALAVEQLQPQLLRPRLGGSTRASWDTGQGLLRWGALMVA